MRKEGLIVIVFALVLLASISIASAFSFSELWGKITGKVVADIAIEQWASKKPITGAVEVLNVPEGLSTDELSDLIGRYLSGEVASSSSVSLGKP